MGPRSVTLESHDEHEAISFGHELIERLSQTGDTCDLRRLGCGQFMGYDVTLNPLAAGWRESSSRIMIAVPGSNTSLNEASGGEAQIGGPGAGPLRDDRDASRGPL